MEEKHFICDACNKEFILKTVIQENSNIQPDENVYILCDSCNEIAKEMFRNE